MFKLLNKKKNNKGFTLVELVIVVAILAILVGLLAPQYTKYVEKSRKSADVDNMDEMVKAVQVYAVDHAIGQTKKTTGGTTTSADTEIIIALTENGVKTGTDGKTDISAGTLKSALDEYVPNWKKINLKSKQWSKAPTATLTIDVDGGVKVAYGPTDFDSYQTSSANN